MAFVIGLETTSRIQYLGILLGLMGVVVLITEASSDLIANFRFNLGDVLVLAAVLFYSLYTVCLVKWRLQLPSYIIMTTSSVSASLILFPLTMFSGFAFIDLWFDHRNFDNFYGGFPNSLATLWNRAINIGANKASVFINLMPVFGALASILIFDDRRNFSFLWNNLVVIVCGWSPLERFKQIIHESFCVIYFEKFVRFPYALILSEVVLQSPVQLSARWNLPILFV